MDLNGHPAPEGAESSPYFCFCSVQWKGVLSMALGDSVLVSLPAIILTINFDIGTYPYKPWGGHQAGRGSGKGVRIQNGEIALNQDNETY